MDEPPLRHPHDRFFKETFSNLDNAREFFQNFLPPSLSQSLDWETLEREERSFLDEALRKRTSDLLFTVRWLHDSTALLFCLFEHQERPDPWMALRMFHYQVLIWREWIKKHPRAKDLPRILPIVLYQGTRPWRASAQFEDLLQSPERVDEEILKELTPGKGLRRIDLQDNDKLDQLTTIPLRVVLSIMRELGKPSQQQDIDKIFRTIADLPDQGVDPEYIRTCITYVFHASRKLDRDNFLKQIHTLESKPNLKENIMTIASAIVRESEARGLEKGKELGIKEGEERGLRKGEERGLRKGEARGLRKGEAKLLRQLLESRFGELPKWAMTKIDKARAEDLEKWAPLVLSASTLNEVFNKSDTA